MPVKTVEELQASLSPVKRTMIFVGCLGLMLAVSSFGLSLNTIQQPLLDLMDASQQFSLLVVLSSIALCVMTPVGGKMADMIGAKNVVLLGGSIVVLSALGLALSKNFFLFALFRFTHALGMGTFISLPFLMVREIYPLPSVPKMMGLLTAALSGGGLIGSYFAGLFLDNNLIFLAVVFPAIFLLIGVPLIYFNLPQKPLVKTPFDFVGFILLLACLASTFLALNYGPKEGWNNLWVVLGLMAGLVLVFVFVAWEKKCAHALIPMALFENKQFTWTLAIGFLTFFYLNAMNAYAPLAVQLTMNQSATVSGTLQIPRAILTIVLPAFVGTWVVKKQGRMWQALAIASLLIFLPFLGLVFTGPKMPVWFVMTMLAFNGIGDCFRAVSLTPATQSTLKPSQMGIGTAMLSFITSLAGVFAGSIYGMVYDGLRAITPGTRGIIDGVDTVFLIASFTGLLALLLVVFIYRPIADRQLKK